MKEKTEYRTLKIAMELDKYDTIMMAIEGLKKKEDVSTARALELIIFNYLSGL